MFSIILFNKNVKLKTEICIYIYIYKYLYLPLLIFVYYRVFTKFKPPVEILFKTKHLSKQNIPDEFILLILNYTLVLFYCMKFAY